MSKFKELFKIQEKIERKVEEYNKDDKKFFKLIFQNKEFIRMEGKPFQTTQIPKVMEELEGLGKYIDELYETGGEPKP